MKEGGGSSCDLLERSQTGHLTSSAHLWITTDCADGRALSQDCQTKDEERYVDSLYLWKVWVQSQAHTQGPFHLVVRTSRCGRDNPGSTPGEDMYFIHANT